MSLREIVARHATPDGKLSYRFIKTKSDWDELEEAREKYYDSLGKDSIEPTNEDDKIPKYINISELKFD